MPCTHACAAFKGQCDFSMNVVVCGPNEALIVSGLGYGDEPKLIVSGRAFVFPCVHEISWVPLSTLTCVIVSERVYTSRGVPISVTGIAQVRKNLNA